MRRLSVLVTAAVAAALLVSPAAGQADPATTPDRPATSPAPVTLVTGEQISAGPAGSPLRVLPVPGRPAALTVWRAGVGTYVVPTTAQPYLGRQLDASLFDVSRLAPAEQAETGRLPVRIGYSGSTPPAVPGVRVTSASGGVALGYLTPASAPDFGAALARQYAADAAAGWPEHRSLFTNVLTLRADVATDPIVRPQFPMVTLIVKVTDAAGRPAPFAFVGIMNADDARRYSGFVPVYRGEARVSVPRGTYTAMTQVADAVGGQLTFRIVSRNEYRVSTNSQTLTLDARSATISPTVSTPRPAAVDTLMFDWLRTDRTGHGSLDMGVAVDGSARVLVAPAPAARVGTTLSDTIWHLHGSAPRGRPYTYDLAFPAVGIPADQSHRVRPAGLGVVAPRYFSDARPTRGATSRAAFLPGRSFVFGFFVPLQLPAVRTEYVSAVPGAVWFASLLPDIDNFENPFVGIIDDGGRVVRAGSRRVADWGRGPLVPRVPVQTSVSPFSFCYACRTADGMLAVFAPFTDSTPGHTGELFTDPSGSPVTRLRLFRNGALLAEETDVDGIQVPVPASAATYRLIDEVDRRSNGARLSQTTRTDLRFRSGAGADRPAPRDWACFAPGRCRVLPLLQVYLDLRLTLDSLLRAGGSTAILRVGHIPGAAGSAITGAALRVRVEGGAWRSVRLTRLADGRYRAWLFVPVTAAGKGVDLQVAARDAAGGTFTQTTTRATVVTP